MDGFYNGLILQRMDLQRLYNGIITDRFDNGWIWHRKDSISDGFYNGWILQRMDL